MRGRIAERDDSVPTRDGDWLYFRRFVEGAEHPIYCRRPAAGGEDQVILDGPKEAAGRAYWRLANLEHAPDHKLVAIAVDNDGSEYCTVTFRNMMSGELLPDVLTNAQGDVAWANDGVTVFYTVLDEQHRPMRVYRHRIGEDPAKDTLVYEEKDIGFYLGLDWTEDRTFVLISGSSHSNTSETWLIDADKPESAPQVFNPREEGHDYDVHHGPGGFFILTNCDGAEDYKIMRTRDGATARTNWVDHLPYKAGRFIRRLGLFRDYLVRQERETALPALVVQNLSDGSETRLAFDEEAYDLGLMRGYEFATSLIRFSYSSMTTPERTFEQDMVTGARALLKEQHIPSGHDASAYVTRRLWATSYDGTKVPITLLHKKGITLGGQAPLFLYGYGSYGSPMPASFASSRLSLVDRGFIFAIAHVRGGNELGFHWYLDGKLTHKMNTFRDFIAAAEHLIAEGYARKGEIVAQGRSAGGMLMGAITNMRPDLFKAILAEVPFVDVLNTICDASLPLTPPEWAEWGNPIESEEDYATIRAYCPYSNVRPQNYPHVLAVGGLTDPRVTYWEPAKWVAKLRAANRADTRVLLHTVMEAGHGGAPGRFARLEELALSQAFALKMSGLIDDGQIGR
jgi:oligopeptidase B